MTKTKIKNNNGTLKELDRETTSLEIDNEKG